jgi:hypothetical protein
MKDGLAQISTEVKNLIRRGGVSSSDCRSVRGTYHSKETANLLTHGMS